ncbi:hypothetical protein [Ktedonospora formicarum]|uniref:hypothetical protein n=1 Tax=Ktedonospora formicarum TaxID=2778364 RepID=UPI001C693A2F|nr:hypothetical protein [Ktedonospora formicarum]
MHLRRNPETEFLREEIVKERRVLRHRGQLALLAYGGSLLLCSFTMVRALSTQQPLVVVLFVSFLMLLLIWGISYGVRAYTKGKLPVQEVDIQQRRQEERVFLFQIAQGQLPRNVGVASIVLKGCCGLFLLCWGLYSWAIYRESSSILLLAVIFLFVGSGLGLIGMTVRDWHRRNVLLKESADILAERLMLGEITEGRDDQER